MSNECFNNKMIQTNHYELGFSPVLSILNDLFRFVKQVENDLCLLNGLVVHDPGDRP